MQHTTLIGPGERTEASFRDSPSTIAIQAKLVTYQSLQSAQACGQHGLQQ